VSLNNKQPITLIKLLCKGSANDHIRSLPAPFPSSAQIKVMFILDNKSSRTDSSLQGF